MIERYHISIFDIFAIASSHAVQRKERPEKERRQPLLLLSTACCTLTTFWFCCCTSAPIAASVSASMVVQFALKAVRFLLANRGRLLLRTPGPSHLGLAFVLMLRPFFPELVMSTDLLSFEHPSVLLFSFKWAPGLFLPLFIAKFWSRYNTSIPTPNQSSSPLWIAASTPDTVPAIPCPLVKRLQPLHQSLCNVWSPPGQSWWSSGGSAFKISALA